MKENSNVSEDRFNYQQAMFGKVEHDEELTIVSVQGEIDIYSSSVFKEALSMQLDKGRTRFIIDLCDVDFIDSSGLGVLVSRLRQAKELSEESRPIRLVCDRDAVNKVFRITGLDRVFPMHKTVDEAKAAFRAAA